MGIGSTAPVCGTANALARRDHALQDVTLVDAREAEVDVTAERAKAPLGRAGTLIALVLDLVSRV